MNTYLLSEDVLRAYAKDLERRLRENGGFPEIWLPVGPSGVFVAQRLAEQTAVEANSVIPVTFDRKVRKVEFRDSEDPAAEIAGKRVLVMDTVINSGDTLLAVLRGIRALRPASVSTYVVAVKAHSAVIPNYFSLLLGDHDRVFVGLNAIENNRLTPSGVYRRLQAEDLDRPMIRSEADFIDRTTWSDHWYEMATDPRKSTIVLEDEAGIRGFISYEVEAGEDLRVDEVAVDKGSQGRRVGGHLVRWAENVARVNRCKRIILWSAEERKNWYANHGCSELGRVVALGPDGAFTLMGKPVLYSLEDPAFPPRIQ